MEICRRLVTHYFLLTKEELAMWEEDPEGFSKKHFVQFVAVYLYIGIRVSYPHCFYELIPVRLAVLFSAVLLHGQLFPVEIVFIVSQ